MEAQEEEGQEEELHYVQGKLPCGVWATWSGRTSKHALVGRDGTVSLAWKDGYQGTRLKAKGRVVAVAETLAPGEPCVVWEVTLRGDCKTFWFRDPEGALPGGFLTREEEQAMQKAYDVTRPRHAPRVERELRDVEYRFTLRYHRSDPEKGSAEDAREDAARGLAHEDPELLAQIRATLEAPGFPFIVEEPMQSQVEKEEEMEMEDPEDY